VASLLGWSKAVLGMVVTAGVALACSEDAAGPTTGSAGTSAGMAASGSAGMPGSAGASAGSTSGGTSAGSAGAAGTSTGGVAGAGTAGSGGSAGSGGAGGAAGTGGSGGAPAQLSDWQYYGRWDLSKAGKAITVNSGSHITASFMGSGISAKFDTSGNTGDIPTVSIKIDDGELVEKEIAGTLELATGLPVALHTVTLFVRGMSESQQRWTPPLVSSTVFTGFTVAGGNIVPTARPTRLKMEFLGDSITEGVALQATGPQGQTSQNWRTNGPRGYAAVTAMKMQAEWRQVGFGRQGLTIVGNGGVPKAQDAFNWFYSGVARDSWQPDIVVINQGTNDRGTSGATFAPLYDSFLGIIRTAYPDAKLVALRPLVGDFGSEISAQVAARKTAGDAKIFYVDTAGWTSNGDFTDGVHPNQSGSVKIADKLMTALQALPN
jgi:lysophospholipase L1-like esterase